MTTGAVFALVKTAFILGLADSPIGNPVVFCLGQPKPVSMLACYKYALLASTLFLANFNNLAYDAERGHTGEYGTDIEEITQPAPRCVYYV